MPASKPKIFLDASVLIAGAASSTGGSAYILAACQKGYFQAITSELVLHEAEKNIVNKLNDEALARFYNLLKTLPIKIQPAAITSDKYVGIIETKDTHVLAAAIESQSDYLLTLDRRHFFTPKIKKAKLPIKIVTPKDFIENW